MSGSGDAHDHVRVAGVAGVAGDAGSVPPAAATADVRPGAATASPYAGQIWAVEVELTAKHADRTAAIMAGLTVWDLPPDARTSGT